MIEKKNIRIKDIARMAGVSVGTVDRVLHGRGKVSPDAAEKVQQVLEQTGYKPNLIARTLGSNKTLKIAALLPDPDQDEYWKLAQSGIQQSIDEWSYYDVEINCFYFDLYDNSSLRTAAALALKHEPAGLLIAPVFYNESLELLNQLTEQSIPYILFNSNIREAKPLCFIGQNLNQSGRVAAELLSLCLPEPGTILVLHIYENLDSSVYLKTKENGLTSYFSGTKYNILSLDLSEPKQIETQVLDAVENQNLKGILVSTSTGTHIVATILENHNLSHIRLVGFDLLKENLKHLEKGTIDFLINQNPKRMAKLGVNHLVNSILFQKSLPEKEVFPIEIITRENMDSYLESTIH